MSVADLLGEVGQGLATGAKAVGKAALPIAQRTAEVLSGEAPQIDATDRQRAEKLEDEQINAKAGQLESQMQMAQKYGTLTPQQQQDYANQITGLYNKPRHSQQLMDKLRQAVHPNGATAQGPQAALPDATPPGGTAAADEANAEKLASARRSAQQKKGFDQFLDIYARDHQIDPSQMTEAQLEDAHTKYYQQTHQQMLDKEIVEDPASPTGFSVSEIDRRTGKQVSSFQGVRPPAGFVPKHRVSQSTDQYGNTVTSVSDITPVMGKPGGGSSGSSSSSTGAKSVGALLGAGRPSTGAKPATATASPSPRIPVLPKKATEAAGLDADGHIPAGKGNPQVTELANELLDGRDAKDLPMKARAAAESMARQYGWAQGAFTPKEKILINGAVAKLQQLQNSPSLNVLNSTLSRNKIAQVMREHDKEGMVGTALSASIAGSLSPEEQEFVRNFRAAQGLVTGLSPLTRGGRPTESGVRRLIAELPTVLESGNAHDAKERIQQLLNEVQVAVGTTGRFPVGGNPSPGESQPKVLKFNPATGRLE